MAKRKRSKSSSGRSAGASTPVDSTTAGPAIGPDARATPTIAAAMGQIDALLRLMPNDIVIESAAPQNGRELHNWDVVAPAMLFSAASCLLSLRWGGADQSVRRSRHRVDRCTASRGPSIAQRPAMRPLFACIIALAACAGEAPPPGPDAAPITNGPFGATCTVVSNTSTECASGVCTDTIDILGHPVCSEQCTYGNNSTCPSGSTGQKCNMQGYCKP